MRSSFENRALEALRERLELAALSIRDAQGRQRRREMSLKKLPVALCDAGFLRGRFLRGRIHFRFELGQGRVKVRA
jgi:hypothetical protein